MYIWGAAGERGAFIFDILAVVYELFLNLYLGTKQGANRQI